MTPDRRYNNVGAIATAFAVAAAVASCGSSDATNPQLTPLSFQQVSAGLGLQSCGLATSGAAYCWGDNRTGALGNGSPLTSSPVCPGAACQSTPLAVATSLLFMSISNGGSPHTCALTGNGAAYCWGTNASGQLGNASNTDATSPVPVAGGLTFKSIAAGEDHTCGLTSSGAAYCWGNNLYGALGDSTTTPRNAPVPVAGGLTFTMISTGTEATCALVANGAAYCWGVNTWGQLGTADTLTRLAPIPVSTILRFTTLSIGFSQACGVTADGSGYCWGDNRVGQLGTGTTRRATSPTPISNGFGLAFASISAGYQTTCGVSTDAFAYCWGDNTYGQMGNGFFTSPTLSDESPNGVDLRPIFKSVSAGYTHTCAVTINNVAYCWGDNGLGDVGDGTRQMRVIPTAVVHP